MEKTTVAIVGGGLAGLVAALRLKQAGCDTQLYEAWRLVGGRTDTHYNLFGGGEILELGGSFIDSNHLTMRGLVKEFGLSLVDLYDTDKEDESLTPLYHVNGASYGHEEVFEDFLRIYDVLKDQARRANRNNRLASELDHLSIEEWIRQYIPGGNNSNFGKLLDVAYATEYGASTRDQSALNLVWLLSGQRKPKRAENFQLFGSSDERYNIREGTKQLIKQLASAVGEDAIHTSHTLVEAENEGSGPVLLTFFYALNKTYRQVLADRVIFALPFSVLRNVRLVNLRLSDKKRQAIEELGMGQNWKIHLQFNGWPWTERGCDGTTFSDTGSQCTWDASGPEDEFGILCNYRMDPMGNFNVEKPFEQVFQELEPLFPDLKKYWTGKIDVAYWPISPGQLGSYSYFRVGQYTAFADAIPEREGSAHFAGEHTSADFQGFMEGAAESGERVAKEVLETLK